MAVLTAAMPFVDRGGLREIQTSRSNCDTRSILDIAKQYRFAEALVGVSGRDEFLSDVSLITEFVEFPHDRGEVDFLLIIQFVSTWTPSDMDMPDDIDMFIESAHDIPVHDLNVVDVEEHFDPFGANTADDLCDKIDVIALVSGVSLHRVGTIAGVEMFEAQSDLGSLGEASELLESCDAIFDAFLTGDLAAGGVFGIPPFESCEGDHIGEAGCGGRFDRLGHATEDFSMIRLVVEPFDKRRTGHSVRGQCAADAMFLQSVPVFKRYDFHRVATELAGHFAQAVHGPHIATRLVAPANDRLPNIFFQ